MPEQPPSPAVAKGATAFPPITLRGAIRDGWHWRNVVRCFVTRTHLLCNGCTPRCGKCAHCHRRLT